MYKVKSLLTRQTTPIINGASRSRRHLRQRILCKYWCLSLFWSPVLGSQISVTGF